MLCARLWPFGHMNEAERAGLFDRPLDGAPARAAPGRNGLETETTRAVLHDLTGDHGQGRLLARREALGQGPRHHAARRDAATAPDGSQGKRMRPIYS